MFSAPMTTLTRRRSDNEQETWHVYYDDVRVGTISKCSGVPIHADRWAWSIGFYPGMEPVLHRGGTAVDFAAARAGFETVWARILPEIPAGAFDEWRSDRNARAEMKAKRARGEKLDSEIPSSMMRCVCGTVFDSWKPDESYPHRAHIYAAQATRHPRR